MRGHGHFFCSACNHAVYASRGGCGTCSTPLAELMLLDDAFDGGFAQPGLGFDPFDGEPVFSLGDGIGIEPGGQVDLDVGGFDIPV
jgi:hypothetical protein